MTKMCNGVIAHVPAPVVNLERVIDPHGVGAGRPLASSALVDLFLLVQRHRRRHLGIGENSIRFLGFKVVHEMTSEADKG